MSLMFVIDVTFVISMMGYDLENTERERCRL